MAAPAEKTRKLLPNSVGMAGEFAVLSQLTLRGWNAALTLGHTKSIDILVSHPNGKARYDVEVKTNFERRRGPSTSALFGRFVTDWQMDKKHEDITDPSLFYCFVHINASPVAPRVFQFRYFVVPSRVVAKYVRDEHKLWLKADPSHRDTPRRLFKIGLPNDTAVALQAPLAEKYEDNWEFRDPA